MLIEEFLAAFTLIFLAEFLDKTQILVVILASKYGAMKTFIAAYSALLTVAILSGLLGQFLSRMIPIARIIAGITFIVSGLYFMFSRNHEILIEDKRRIIHCYSFILLAELGDKTQITVITLSMICSSFAITMLGVAIAFAIVTLVGIYMGDRLRKVSEKYEKKLNLIACTLFIVLGLFLLISNLA